MTGGRLNNNKADVEEDGEDLGQRSSSSSQRTSRDEIGENNSLLRTRSMLSPLVPLFSFSWKRRSAYPTYFTMILLPIYLGLLSQAVLFPGGAEGNSEIESCMVQTRSSSSLSSSGASSLSSATSSNGIGGGIGNNNGLGYYSSGSGSFSVQNNNGGGLSGVSGAAGASGSSGGVGANNNNNNNNESPVAAALVDPHSTILCHIRTLHPELDLENLTSSISSGGNMAGVAFDISSITRLTLVCNDVLFFESSVKSGQLSSLSELHELTIEKCKLKHLPGEFFAGLTHLRKLSINTGNSDWAARSLELSPTAFTSVPQLRHLSLGFNHAWNLPEGVLCKLSLQSLNLTHNNFADIDDIGLPGRPALGTSGGNVKTSMECLNELKILDVSHNNIRTLGSRRLEHLKHLQELRLNDNWIEELEDGGMGSGEGGALYGLSNLHILKLNSNRIVALSPTVFQNCCKLLRELDLRNNSLTALNPGLLNRLEHLQILDLSHNALNSQMVTADAFKSLVRLVILSLSHNQLTHLNADTFQDLYTLQVLDLSSNLIHSIEDNTFSPLNNLHTLHLGENRIKTINSNMLSGMFVLHKLILDHNKIDTIETGAMKNLTSLQDLGLSRNEIREVGPWLKDLKLLRTLDLGENKIADLQNGSFAGLSHLYGLRIVANAITEIPTQFCSTMSRLRVFNAAQNSINKISSTAFSACPELRVLRLDSNRLETIPQTLAPQLPNLLWLNMSGNSIEKVDYSFLPPALEWLDVSRNTLSTIGWFRGGAGAVSNLGSSLGSSGGNGSKNTGNNNSKRFFGTDGSILPPQHGNGHHHNHFTDHRNSRLRVVDASHNAPLEVLDSNAVPNFIEVLRLNHCRLKQIAPDTFGRASNLRRVELIGNQLENIPLTALRLPPPTNAGKPQPEFFLGGNPFLCNCEMEWLTRINNQLSPLRQHPTVLDLDAIVCRLPYGRSITHVPLPEIKPQDFLCEYSGHCFHLCHCCEFEACDCKMQCPGNCTCYHDDTWSANVVNCAGSSHTTIPSRLPMDSTEIYLDGNNIPTLKSHTFIGRKNLRILMLNHSNIETINNKSFNGLLSLQKLHLEHNKLRKLVGFEFDHLSRLRELFLQNNLISSISNSTFLPLKSLEILRLDGNRLVAFPVWQLSLNPYLVEIGLARNPWNCECAFLHQLYGWVTDNSRKVLDLVQLQCVWNTTHKPGPHLIDYNRTCGSSWALMGIENGFDFTTLSPLPLALAFVSVVTVIIICIAFVVICRHNVTLWLFTRFNGFRLCAAADYEDDKSYDSYLIYSQKDEEFVAQRIADELESNDNYRLCLHYRDLICETGDLREMMVGAVDNAKSVVIILSRNFLQGEWCSGEYRSAFHAILKKSQRGSANGGGTKAHPKKILIVFIEDIPKVEINPDIRAWVRHNKIQVIRWNIHSTDYTKNRKFWNKLKFALPDPSSHYHSNITSNTTTTSASSTEGHGGIMATLKYATTSMQGDSHLHHPISIQQSNIHQPHHQQIIVDESGRFTTLMATGPASSSQTNTLNSTKYWPYGATNFVALPPKYQQSHHSSSGGSSHPPSVNSPGSAQSLHYHPPLPLTNPPKSPPSSQSTDSTTTTVADDAPSLMSQLTMASFHSNNGHSLTKSPVPVPKSSYALSSPRNNLVNSAVNSTMNNSLFTTSNAINSGGGVGGESYLSVEAEHVYSTLDPPSPQPPQQQQSMSLSQNILPNNSVNTSSSNNIATSNFLNNIHLPNGYTYQPQSTINHQYQQQQHHLPPHHSQFQQQWLGAGGGSSHSPLHLPNNSHQSPSSGGAGGKHGNHHPHQVMSSFVGGPPNMSSASSPMSGGVSKGFNNKQNKDGNNPVQTYLV